ncbi:MAG: hypothetical protein JXA01_10270 [Dehalococcoidia bacterium]|nr:hypothetical protein [Dehalococcoidia bacterium]
MRKRAVALTNPQVVDQLCEAIISKLTASNCLLSSGSRVRIPPGTPAKLKGAVAFQAAGRGFESLQGRQSNSTIRSVQPVFRVIFLKILILLNVFHFPNDEENHHNISGEANK